MRRQRREELKEASHIPDCEAPRAKPLPTGRQAWHLLYAPVGRHPGQRPWLSAAGVNTPKYGLPDFEFNMYQYLDYLP